MISNKKIAFIGMMTAVALMLSYLETFIPLNIGIPGIKIGLANVVTVAILYKTGIKEVYLVTVVRIILSGIIFSGLSTIIYGLMGAICSITVMYIVKKRCSFSETGVSVLGAIANNLGQIIIATIIVKNAYTLYYFPVLLISGTAFGVGIGLVAAILLRSIKRIDIRV